MPKSTIVDVNGVVLSVDEKYTSQSPPYKIGDHVKVLVKQYSDTYKTYPGIIVSFDNFQARPTIVIAYLETAYGTENPIKFVYYNKDSKDVEICPMRDDYISVEKSTVLDLIDNSIAKKQQEIFDLEKRREFFLKNFLKLFSDFEMAR